MSNTPGPPHVTIVSWSGESTALACRLGIPHDELLAGLRRVGRKAAGHRLVVDAAPANTAPLLAALRRRLNRDGADDRA
jgi:hypothetical protein